MSVPYTVRSAVNTETVAQKQTIINILARIAIAAVIRAFTNQIISWIQGNNGQNAGFVQNLEQSLKQQANAAGGAFLQQLALTPQPPGCTPGVNCQFNGIDICTANLRQFLQISLRAPGIQQQLGCTLSDIGAKAESFFQDFQQGGWPAFIKIGLEPQNNPYGAYLIALDAKVEAEDAAGRAIGAQYQTNKGFLGFAVDRNTNCRPISEDEANAVQTIQGFGGRQKQKVITTTDGPLQERELCDVVQDVKTPGNLVSDLLSQAAGSDLSFLNSAREIDDAIIAVANALIGKLITSSTALFSSSGEQTGSGSGIFEPGLSRITTDVNGLAGNSVARQADDAIMSADAALKKINQSLAVTQQNLFAARKKISDIAAQIKALQNQLPSPENDAQIKTLQDQLPALQQTVADAETKITIQLGQQRDLLASEAELMGIKNALTGAGTSQDIVNAGSQFTAAQSRLNQIISQIQDIPPAAASTGDPKQDTTTMLSNAERNVRDEIALFTAMLAEIDRLIADPTTSAEKKQLLSGQSGKRTEVAAEITRLNEQLVALTNLESRLNAATTDDDIRFARQDIINRILISDRELASANTAMTAIIPILKP